MVNKTAIDPAESLISLGHLSSGVGHHVINAFSAIVSNAELLRLPPTVSQVPDPATLADTIIKTALDAATVARRLIDYTRPITSIEPDPAAFQTETLAIDRLAAEVVEAERRSVRPNTTWDTDLKSVAEVRGHDAQLRSMLSYLIRNSRESLRPQGGTIRVSTTTDARGWIALEIRDDGRGMDTATLQRAVEPFFSTKPGHLGVGLSIANGIWRRHRGTLSIQSQPEDGTLVRLCVEPIHKLA